MQNRMTSRKRQGDTAVKDDVQKRASRAPHERDESADSQAQAEPSSERVGQAAIEDVKRGVVDSSTGPVLDRTYDKVREGAKNPEKKFSP